MLSRGAVSEEARLGGRQGIEMETGEERGNFPLYKTEVFTFCLEENSVH